MSRKAFFLLYFSYSLYLISILLKDVLSWACCIHGSVLGAQIEIKESYGPLWVFLRLILSSSKALIFLDSTLWSHSTANSKVRWVLSTPWVDFTYIGSFKIPCSPKYFSKCPVFQWESEVTVGHRARKWQNLNINPDFWLEFCLFATTIPICRSLYKQIKIARHWDWVSDLSSANSISI